MTAAVHGAMRQDTRAILRVAGGIEAVGVLFAIVVWANGGMTSHGPHGNLAWFALIVALGCIPTGSFFLLLGFAKWLGDRGRTD
jgi:hypothetical protein